MLRRHVNTTSLPIFQPLQVSAAAAFTAEAEMDLDQLPRRIHKSVAAFGMDALTFVCRADPLREAANAAKRSTVLAGMIA